MVQLEESRPQGKCMVDEGYGDKPVYRRSSHKKSRGGCRSCKLRRVKCDETRDGGCRKCTERGLLCDYLMSNSSSAHKRALQPTKEDNDPRSTIVACQGLVDPHGVGGFYGFNLQELLVLCGKTSLPSMEESAFAVKAMHHFETVTSSTMGSYLAQEIISQRVLKMVTSSPHLFHAVLGISAAHLQYLLPVKMNPSKNREHQVAETKHWQQALKLFRAEMSQPERFGSHNMDSILTTCMILSVQTFSLSSDGTTKSFLQVPASERESALSWITGQRGLKALNLELEHCVRNSVWFPVFIEADNFGSSPHQDELDVDRVMELLGGLTRSNLVYRDPRDLLDQQLRIEPSVATFHNLITLPARLEAPFLDLLRSKDPAALLILAYWLGHISKIGFWWITPRAQFECAAICQELCSNSDLEIQELLQFPAAIAGFRRS